MVRGEGGSRTGQSGTTRGARRKARWRTIRPRSPRACRRERVLAISNGEETEGRGQSGGSPVSGRAGNVTRNRRPWAIRRIPRIRTCEKCDAPIPAVFSVLCGAVLRRDPGGYFWCAVSHSLCGLLASLDVFRESDVNDCLLSPPESVKQGAIVMVRFSKHYGTHRLGFSAISLARITIRVR